MGESFPAPDPRASDRDRCNQERIKAAIEGGFGQDRFGDRYSGQGKIAYVHLRNVKGKVPNYREAFIDEGDVDMVRILSILKRNSFDGVIIPDHTPQMSCSAPWHAGMAHALGYMAGALASLRDEQVTAKKVCHEIPQ